MPEPLTGASDAPEPNSPDPLTDITSIPGAEDADDLFGVVESEVASAPKEPDIAPAAFPDLKLKAIMYAGVKSSAVINGNFVRVGDPIEGWQIISIREHEVILQNGGEQRVLGLR
jgi:hypothetical protein